MEVIAKRKAKGQGVIDLPEDIEDDGNKQSGQCIDFAFDSVEPEGITKAKCK